MKYLPLPTCKACDHPYTEIAWRYALNGYYCEDCYGAYLDHMSDRASDEEITRDLRA